MEIDPKLLKVSRRWSHFWGGCDSCNRSVTTDESVVLLNVPMNEDVLQAVASRVRKYYPGAQVIIFGSAAEGRESEESDIDLCIIIEEPGERLRNISRRIRRELYPILKKPIDILIYDRDTFEDRASLSVTFEAEIMERGKAL